MGSGSPERLRYDVLGPFAVRAGDGDELRVPVGRQRLLLALLVAAVPRHVAVDALVEELWPGGDGTRSALQVIVHRLRRRIGEERLVLEASGYRLVADADDVDAAGFTAAVRAAWQDVEVEPARALRTLEAALALWRGDPYGGIGRESGTLEAEAVRLAEVWLDACEARAGAALALGRAAETVEELRGLVAGHPLREKLHAQLMLALYRSGRTAEALEAFRAARSVFVEELGLEPGPELRDLEQAILTEDPVLAAPPAPVVRPPAPVRPAQLPPPDAAFVGREDDVAGVVEALLAGTGVVVIDGPGGVGKSALAVAAAHQAAPAFGGGTLYANLRGTTPGATPRDPAVVLERFLHALGTRGPTDTGDAGDAAAEFRSRTADAGVLVVLDDAASLAQVRQLLPGAGSAAVITSRAALGGLAGGARVHVDLASAELGVAMLARAVGHERVAAEPEAAARIVASCGGLPLAVRIAAAHLVAAPRRRLAAVADRLGEESARLDELASGDLAVRPSLEVGLRDAGPEAARLFALLGIVALPHVSAAAAARLADVPLGAARRRLDELAAARLLEEVGDERYAMHDLVRLVAQERAAGLDRDERLAALRRLGRHYLASAQAVARAMDHDPWSVRFSLAPPVDAEAELAVRFADGVAAAQWVRDELATIAAVADAVLTATRDRDAVAGLLAPLFAAIRSQGMGAAATHLYAPFRAAQDPLARADIVMLLDAAVMLEAPGAMAEAATRPLAAARELGDRELLVHCLNVRAIGLTRDDRHDDALALYQEALHVAVSDDLEHARGTVLPNLAKSLGHLGRHDEAIELLRGELGGPPGRSRAHRLGRLAGSTLAAGRAQDAMDLYAEAVEELLASGHTLLAAIYMWHHAGALESSGRADDAAARRREALDLVVDVGRLTPEEADAIMEDPPTEPEELDVLRRI